MGGAGGQKHGDKKLAKSGIKRDCVISKSLIDPFAPSFILTIAPWLPRL
jgi:hypothetical protein